MATGKSGSFTVAGTKSMSAKCYWSETYDVASNTHVVSIDKICLISTNWYGFTYYLDGTVSVESATVVSFSSSAGGHSCTIGSQYDEYPIEASSGFSAPPWYSGEITGNADGSCSATITLNFTGLTINGDGANGFSVSGSSSVTLATIPRASTIGATDANIGATSMIAVNRKSNGYTHSIAYKFGTLSGYVTSSGGVSTTESKFTNTSIAFTVPTSFYAQIPNAKTGTCTLTIKTYSGTTQIGDAQTCTFVATAAEASCKPTVSGTIEDSNATTKALTGDASKLVRYYSTALCTITATAKNSATISSKTIGGIAVSGTTRSITNVESGSVAFAAKDSRGYSASATVNATMVSYVKLTNNAVGTRTEPTTGNAKLTIKGDYFNGSFGAVSNALTVKWRLSGGTYATVTPTISGNTYSANVALSGLDYTQAYTYEVVVSDKLASVTKTVTIGKGVPVFDWGETDFSFHVPVHVSGNKVTGLSAPTDSSDATPKSYVDNKASVSLLWENASPTSEFAAQTLSLGLQSYGMYIIIARHSDEIGNCVSVLQRAGYSCRLVSVTSESSGGANIVRSIDYVTGGSLQFYNALANGSTDNTKLIPLFIYGIKGVQN